MPRATAAKQARSQYILESARRLFDEQGLENCSMDDLAAAAEYTRRTLYSYFKSRDELYLRIHLEDLARRWERQREALETVAGGLDRILAWAEVYIAYGRENPQSLRMEGYWDFHGVVPDRIAPEVFQKFEALNEELAATLRRLFREGIADGSLRPELEVDMSISQFLYSLRAVTNRAFSRSYSFAQFDPDAYLQHFLDGVVRAISNPGDQR